MGGRGIVITGGGRLHRSRRGWSPREGVREAIGRLHAWLEGSERAPRTLAVAEVAP